MNSSSEWRAPFLLFKFSKKTFLRPHEPQPTPTETLPRKCWFFGIRPGATDSGACSNWRPSWKVPRATSGLWETSFSPPGVVFLRWSCGPLMVHCWDVPLNLAKVKPLAKQKVEGRLVFFFVFDRSSKDFLAKLSKLWIPKFQWFSIAQNSLQKRSILIQNKKARSQKKKRSVRRLFCTRFSPTVPGKKTAASASVPSALLICPTFWGPCSLCIFLGVWLIVLPLTTIPFSPRRLGGLLTRILLLCSGVLLVGLFAGNVVIWAFRKYFRSVEIPNGSFF